MEKKIKDLQNTIYYGLIAVFILWLASSTYLVMQNNALKASLESNTIANDAELSSKLKNIESRLSVLEITTDYPSAKLKFYYDSTCKECNNTYWLSHLLESPAPGVETVKTKLAKKNVVLEIIDVSKSNAPADIKRVPAFLVGINDFQANRELAEYYRGAANFADAYDGENAIILVPNHENQKTILVHGEDCATTGSARLDKYSIEDCLLCDSAEIAEETLITKLGDSLTKTNYCIATNEEDQVNCINSVGEEAYKESQELYTSYQLPKSTTRPTYVLDCKQVFKAQNYAELNEAICGAHNELCDALNLNVTQTEGV